MCLGGGVVIQNIYIATRDECIQPCGLLHAFHLIEQNPGETRRRRVLARVKVAWISCLPVPDNWFFCCTGRLRLWCPLFACAARVCVYCVVWCGTQRPPRRLAGKVCALDVDGFVVVTRVHESAYSLAGWPPWRPRSGYNRSCYNCSR